MEFTGIEAFIQAVKAIRSREGGCPWDLAQTHESLIPYFREEVEELIEALQITARLGEKAASFGFDWPNAEGVLDKLKEECDELLESKTPSHQKEELGDIFFVLAQYSRKKGWDPEEILQAANLKFKRRFD